MWPPPPRPAKPDLGNFRRPHISEFAAAASRGQRARLALRVAKWCWAGYAFGLFCPYIRAYIVTGVLWVVCAVGVFVPVVLGHRAWIEPEGRLAARLGLLLMFFLLLPLLLFPIFAKFR